MAKSPISHVPALASEVQRGVCYAHSWSERGTRGYATPTSRTSLDELRDLGVTWVSLTPFGFVESLQSDEVRPAGAWGESNERVASEIREARARDIQVLLKPHLWVRGGAWRAELDPAGGWPAFFTSYREWILAYARLAQEAGAPILAVGTELRSSIGRESEWRELIAAVREVYDGELVYCANWDEVDDVPFWDALDFVGVQLYAPLADGPEASPSSMRARLDIVLDSIGALSARVSRPVLLTEVGFKSTADTAVRPYEWTEHRRDAVVDQGAQERAYRVLFQELDGRSWLEGVYIWKWFTDPETDEEGPHGFSPRGKRAEEVLREAFRAR